MSKRSAAKSARRKHRKSMERFAWTNDSLNAHTECVADPVVEDTPPIPDLADRTSEGADEARQIAQFFSTLNDAPEPDDEWEPGREWDEPRYDEFTAARRLGLEPWQFTVAVRTGLIPDHGYDRLWSQRVIDAVLERAEEIRQQVGSEFPVGAWRGAERISSTLGVPFGPEDFRVLVNQGLLSAVSEWKGSPTYSVKDMDRLCAEHGDAIRRVILDHERWLDQSYSHDEALQLLGWTAQELGQALTEHRMARGRAGRYAHEDIAILLEDDELDARIQQQRAVGPNEATQLLGIRRRDFDYCVAAGWIAPVRWTQSQIRGRTVDVPLYRIGDVEGLLELPDVDWAAVRAVAPGKTSPLRQYAELPISRAEAMREFVARIAARYGVPATAEYRWRHDEWRIRWTRTHENDPTIDTITAEWKADPELAHLITTVVMETGPVDERVRIRPSAHPTHGAGEALSPVSATGQTWETVRPKIAGRLQAGRAPALSRGDARILAAELNRCGVEPTRLKDPAAWSNFSEPWSTNETPTGTAEHIAALCGRLEDSVELRFAANLSKRDAKTLLDFIDDHHGGQTEPICLDD